MPDVFTFIGVDDVSPKLQNIRAELVATDAEVNKFSASSDKASGSTHKFTEKLTTFNTRTLAAKIGITALTFALVRYAKEAAKSVEETEKLNGMWETNRKNLQEFRNLLALTKSEVGDLTLDIENFLGRLANKINPGRVAIANLIAEWNKGAEEARKFAKEIDEWTVKNNQAINSINEHIDSLKLKTAVLKATNEVEKETLIINDELRQSEQKLDQQVKDKIITEEQARKKKEELRNASDMYIKTIKEEVYGIAKLTVKYDEFNKRIGGQGQTGTTSTNRKSRSNVVFDKISGKWYPINTRPPSASPDKVEIKSVA